MSEDSMEVDDVEEYEGMSSQQLKNLIDEGGLSQTTMKDLLQIYVRKVDAKNAIIHGLDTWATSSAPITILRGDARIKKFKEWADLCNHQPFNNKQINNKMFCTPGTPVFKRVAGTQALIMSPLTEEEAKHEVVQNYGAPIRSLNPINGKMFCMTGEYVMAATTYEDPVYAAYQNLYAVKLNLLDEMTKESICEHIENFEKGEYYNRSETVALEIYSTSKYPADQIRCDFRRTRPCVGARKKLKAMKILEDFQEHLDEKWEDFVRKVANFDECVPPDFNAWTEIKDKGRPKTDPAVRTCKCMKCVQQEGPNGRIFERPWNFQRHTSKLSD